MSCVVTWIRGLRVSNFYMGCVGYVGQNIFYVGQHFTWVAWVAWANYIFAWVFAWVQSFYVGEFFFAWVNFYLLDEIVLLYCK